MTSTYVIELTPPGRSAVAVVMVAGPDAVRVVGECFAPVSGRPLAELPIGRIALGRWGASGGEELIVCRRSAEEIEIHCHGGTAAVGAIIDGVIERGCRRISWQDWLQGARGRVSPKLAFASRRDGITCAAQIALAEARTERAAGVLLDQYHGALSRAVRSAIDAVEDANWGQAGQIVDGVLRYGDLGLHLTRPWSVVLAGAPNVGKSSLINALAGYERAIVSPHPGTTRDVVTTTTAIAGWPVQLADTAGLRATADELESAGVALAAGALRDADLVVAVVDAGNACGGIDDSFPPHALVIAVQNKFDLLDASAREAAANTAAIATSALTGEGLADLVGAIARALVPATPRAGAAVPFTSPQVAGLESARRAIDREDGSKAVAALNALLTG
jgi:tRNA modification GTPase